ncbi:MAG: family 65 glycosyl hydrolase domain-containing protein [Bacteroidota bacterium]
MKQYIVHDEWNIIEDGFQPENNRISESLFSIGNGKMGHRANFEEYYSGDSLQGSYVAGVYYPDKTKVGWWKNGYPEYFAKVLNAANWIGIDLHIGKFRLDLAKCNISAFTRILHMKEGYLERHFIATLPDGKEIEVHARRFCSIVNDEVGEIEYRLKALNFNAEMEVCCMVDFDVVNEDSNYKEKFWKGGKTWTKNQSVIVKARTKKTDFHVATGMQSAIFKGGKPIEALIKSVERKKFAAIEYNFPIKQGEEIVIRKTAIVVSSMNYPKPDLMDFAKKSLKKASGSDFEKHLKKQAKAWAKKWDGSDIIIKGDVAAQQGIRFNIFHMNQTYTGEDDRLNIGPKGFTGEKYGGSTYWDTEAYCLPFYMSTAPQEVGRQLLVYRYKHLFKAIENAEKLGFSKGAALYPMVTMNGEECHNEWEITFEEIHRNGAIAYAIYDYIRYTGDEAYLADYGLEVLVSIARFWVQRADFSPAKQQYVILGVTGPNEYENNVNNNWYTNFVACWCLEYAMTAMEKVKAQNQERYQTILDRLEFQTDELVTWQAIRENMFFPESEALGIFLQQEGFLDKPQLVVDDLPKDQRPINQNWSWDRILRSVFIKQADVLQGLYFFEDRFDQDTIRRNFDYYEPRTVHESSLSPCVHVILAAALGYKAKAYEMYLRTARLDLDDYNNDTEDGLHITSMAGTWMSVVKGFGGMRVREDKLSFKPFLPDQWEGFSFKIRFRGSIIKVNINQSAITVENQSSDPMEVWVDDKLMTIEANSVIESHLELTV